MIDHYRTRDYRMLLRRLFCAVWVIVDVVRQMCVDVVENYLKISSCVRVGHEGADLVQVYYGGVAIQSMC